jgi:integrase/recombinase XerD
MQLIWATTELTIAGYPYPGFPILLWDSMDSCIPANSFFRYYLLRGAIGSRKSWPSLGRALYDFFSFLSVHKLDWREVERGEAKSLLAAYRDYCLKDSRLARTTVRQRVFYVCKFYEYAQRQGWVSSLPFSYEERFVKRGPGFLAHIDASGGKYMANDVLPRNHPLLPKFLTSRQISALLAAADNQHHRIIIQFALQTGLRREEIATFPLAYVVDPDMIDSGARNIRIHLDPQDGHRMLTKGSKPRDITVSRSLLAQLHRYAVQIRGERASLSASKHQALFLNQYGEPFAEDGKGLERIVRKIGRRVGIDVHPHMLRHTYATHTLILLQRSRPGIEPLVFLQRQLGHESIQTTMVYLHLINELVEGAVLAYDDELNENMGRE